MVFPERIQTVLDATEPLEYGRGARLPLYLWPCMDPGDVAGETLRKMLAELDERGIGLVVSWQPSEERRGASLARALEVGRAQQEMGLRISANANACLYSFFNGDERTMHVDADGEGFWDESFGKGHKMGCPFTLGFREAEIRDRVEYFAKGYREAGLDLGFVFADWEIDGPIEVNRAHEAALRCVRCRERIDGIESFETFQKTVREMRSRLQKTCYAQPILSLHPDCLVGNYAIYPNNGLRYWYDYFEFYVEGQPCVKDRGARYRRWAQDFPGTGYTFAMPVVYTWYDTFRWYEFEDPDYRWFYNMLLVASNAGRSAPPEVPIVAFVHWHTTSPPKDPDPAVKQFGAEAYQELHWHMLLRGTDTFFLWSPRDEEKREVELLHPVYAQAARYGEFLEKGEPVTFHVPKDPAPVVSGLKLNNRVLVRRTEFGEEGARLLLDVDGRRLEVPAKPGECQILELD